MRFRNLRSAWLALLLAIILATACAPAEDEPDNNGQDDPTVTPVVTATVPEPAATATPEEVDAPPDVPENQEPVIILHQSGGFAGVMNKWEIYSDGRMADGAGLTSLASTEAVAELLQTIRGTGFFDDQPGKPRQICCDHFVFTLTVADGDTKRTHEFNDGDEAALESVRLAIAAVQDFLALATFE